jgi:hypothetical protein
MGSRAVEGGAGEAGEAGDVDDYQHPCQPSTVCKARAVRYNIVPVFSFRSLFRGWITTLEVS